MAESSGQTIFWNELTPNVKMLFVFSLQAVCLGFDCTYLIFYSHQTYSGLPLSFAILSFSVAAFLGTTAVIFIRTKINNWLLLFIFATASSIYPLYTLWKSQNSEETYVDIAQENEHSTKLLFLCSVIGFFTNALFQMFPYFVFSYNRGEMIPLYFIIFSASLCIGRIVYTVICRQNEHNIILSLSFVLCGVSVCIYSFEPARLISSALYGFGFSMILPSLTLYIGRQSQNHVNILVSGFFLAPLVSPFFLTLTLNTFGPQFFTSINFLTLIITVFFFVWLLNVQSKMDKPEGEHSAKVWWFFRGEGALKRTKSLRKFIGSIRGSIRGRRYRRMQGAASPLNGTSPTPTIQLNSPNRLSPHTCSKARTYRSTQSRIKKPRIEIEDESSSGATVSTPTK
uniref:Uncharacterized protein n=1 Tax=Panagrolaimus sp. PS1159 TaxID=55785 RepID=A0AC35FFW5_9BILA